MFTRKLLVLAASFSISSLVALTGCSTEAGTDDGEISESNLDATRALAGSYKGHGEIRGLILGTNGPDGAKRFIADIRSGERVTGTFAVTGNRLTLDAENAPPRAAALFGVISFSVEGEWLVLRQPRMWQWLQKVDSYCSVDADCELQNVIHPECLGRFTCSEARTCEWSCGTQPPPPPVDPCSGLEEEACKANPDCQPNYGPSLCSPDGLICTQDIVYKGCAPKTPTTEPAQACFSSDDCPAGKHCTTDDGACDPVWMLPVCTGVCVD